MIIGVGAAISIVWFGEVIANETSQLIKMARRAVSREQAPFSHWIFGFFSSLFLKMPDISKTIKNILFIINHIRNNML